MQKKTTKIITEATEKYHQNNADITVIDRLFMLIKIYQKYVEGTRYHQN